RGRGSRDGGGDGLRRAAPHATGTDEGGGVNERSSQDAAARPRSTPGAQVEERVVDISIIRPFPATTAGRSDGTNQRRPNPEEPTTATMMSTGTGSPPTPPPPPFPPSVYLPTFGAASATRANPSTPPPSGNNGDSANVGGAGGNVS
ncbi:unnamed protein product, partial [Laminaria digitata]